MLTFFVRVTVLDVMVALVPMVRWYLCCESWKDEQ